MTESRGMGRARRACRRAREIGQVAFYNTKVWWRQHRDRMNQEWGYAQAWTESVLTAVDLITQDRRARHIVKHVIAAYVALLRALAAWRSDWEPQP